jgi:hypothetical protein
MRVWVSAFVGLAVSFKVVAGTAVDKSKVRNTTDNFFVCEHAVARNIQKESELDPDASLKSPQKLILVLVWFGVTG